VIEHYAALGQPIPKNSSDDALHADHVYKFTAVVLTETSTVEAWLAELRRLAMVVCVRPARTTSWRGVEARGTTGPEKYSAAGVEFAGSVLPWIV
jgi:hypothetical protein